MCTVLLPPGVNPTAVNEVYHIKNMECTEENVRHEQHKVYVVYVYVFLGSIIICQLYKLTLSYRA